ncbi:LCP family protein [Nocardioides limicola]|uniref:LCP family protein n=1 Tax=Nocardioides limicola TaxID=2803368 RepID=UPI00193C33E7|nr:LCP family protein [Nocardioides sp. DJM-14]
MAERPGTPGPRPGTPEYDWLYGSGTAGTGQPDQTRILPAEPTRRGVEGTRATQDGPAKPPVRPGPPPLAQPTPPRRRRRLRPGVLLVVLVLALVAYLVAVPYWAWTQTDRIDAWPTEARPASQPGTTYLILGSDTADDLTPEQQRQVRAGVRDGSRADTIMLLRVGSGPNVLMSIPRDSIVAIPGRGTTKINAAHAFGGAPLMVATIEQNTGIRVDHVVELGFGSVVNMVDALGGIEVCPESAMVDKDARLDIAAGCQEVDGVTALAYARSRKTGRLGDINRAENQREVVSAIGHKALSPWTVLNPVRWWQLNTAAAGTVTTSEGTGLVAMGRFALALTRAGGDSTLTCGIPIRDLQVNWDTERAERLFARIIAGETDRIGRQLCTPTGLPR